MSRYGGKNLGVVGVKALGDNQEIINYLSNILTKLGSSSTIEDVKLYPEVGEQPYVIIRHDDFLYKTSIKNLLQKKSNLHSLTSCLNPLDFINYKVNLLHGGSISYVDERGPNVKLSDKVTCNCPIHGNFSKKLGFVLNGKGCPKCSNELAATKSRKDLSYYIEKFREVHGDRFKYLDLTIVDNSKSRVLVECSIHGKFIQDTGSHVHGVGCPKCARQKHIDNSVGFRLTDWVSASNRSKKFDSFKLYVIKCTDEISGETFYKVGRTFNKVKQRYKSKDSLPYDYEIISVVGSTDPEFIYKLENEIKNDLTTYRYIPKKKFGGMKECFSKQPILNEYIHKY